MPTSFRESFQRSPVLICASAGVIGTLLGFALFVLWEEKLEEGEAFALFLISLVLAMLMASWGEWMLELIPGTHTERHSSPESNADFFPRTLLYLLLLAMLEISVMAVHALAKSPAKYAELLGRFSIGTGSSDKFWYLVPQIGLWLVIGGMLGWRLAAGFAQASSEQRYSIWYGARIGAVTGLFYVVGAVFSYGLLIRFFGVVAWIRSDPDSWWSAVEAEKNNFSDDIVSHLFAALFVLAKLLTGWLVSSNVWSTVAVLVLLLGNGYAWRYRPQSFPRILTGSLIALSVVVVLLVLRDFDDLLVRGFIGGLFAAYLWFLPAVFLGVFLPFLEALATVRLEEVPPVLRIAVRRLRQLDQLLAAWVPVAIVVSITLLGLSILFSSYWPLAIALVILAVVSLTRPPEKIRNYWPVFALLVFYVLGAVTSLVQAASFCSIQAQMRLINPPTPSIRFEETRNWFPDLHKELLWAELNTPPKNIEAVLELLRTNRAKRQVLEHDVELAEKAAQTGKLEDQILSELTGSFASYEIGARKKINDLLEFELWVQLDLAKVSIGEREFEDVRKFTEQLQKENLHEITTLLERLTPNNREHVWKLVNDDINDRATLAERLKTLKRTTADEVITVDVLPYQLPGVISRKIVLESRLAELTAKGHSDHADSTGPARLQLAIVVSVGFWLTVGLLAAWSVMQYNHTKGLAAQR